VDRGVLRRHIRQVTDFSLLETGIARFELHSLSEFSGESIALRRDFQADERAGFPFQRSFRQNGFIHLPKGAPVVDLF